MLAGARCHLQNARRGNPCLGEHRLQRLQNRLLVPASQSVEHASSLDTAVSNLGCILPLTVSTTKMRLGMRMCSLLTRESAPLRRRGERSLCRVLSSHSAFPSSDFCSWSSSACDCRGCEHQNLIQMRGLKLEDSPLQFEDASWRIELRQIQGTTSATPHCKAYTQLSWHARAWSETDVSAWKPTIATAGKQGARA